MLKEITMDEAFKAHLGHKQVLVLDGDQVKQLCNLVNYWRFLIEEEEAMEKEERESHAKKKHGTSTEQEVLEAWKGGERSIKEIMQITGKSYQTVRRYIPESKNG